jgi:hypothetical protein
MLRKIRVMHRLQSLRGYTRSLRDRLYEGCGVTEVLLRLRESQFFIDVVFSHAGVLKIVLQHNHERSQNQIVDMCVTVYMNYL